MWWGGGLFFAVNIWKLIGLLISNLYFFQAKICISTGLKYSKLVGCYKTAVTFKELNLWKMKPEKKIPQKISNYQLPDFDIGQFCVQLYGLCFVGFRGFSLWWDECLIRKKSISLLREQNNRVSLQSTNILTTYVRNDQNCVTFKRSTFQHRKKQ